jgi:hypothetical protein
MLPQFPSSRFKVWVEQYDRLPDAFWSVSFPLLLHEEFPQHLTVRARVCCNYLKIVDGVRTLINYHGSMAHYLSQRWEIFGDTDPTSFEIIDDLTDEEHAYFREWYIRYGCSWPRVGGSRPHPQLLALHDRSRTHMFDWHRARADEPVIDDFHIVVEYRNGEVHSRRTRGV